MLDYEIWKASHMLNQTTPYDDENDEDENDSLFNSIDDWSKEGMKQFDGEGWVSVERLI